MASLEELNPSTSVRDITPDGLATVVNVEWYGSDAVELTYKEASGRDLGLLTNAVRSALRSKHDLLLENLAVGRQNLMRPTDTHDASLLAPAC